MVLSFASSARALLRASSLLLLALAVACSGDRQQQPDDQATDEPVQQTPATQAPSASANPNQPVASPIRPDTITVTVYKTASCECCAKWAEHMKQAGFKVVTINHDDLPVFKRQQGVPDDLATCHTALMGGYVIEGHVPAQDIIAILNTRPADLFGIAVAGMPMGSPGMESSVHENFPVLMVFKDGTRRVYTTHF